MGFRADKDPEKMIGIRRGPENQFEITPVKLSLNGGDIEIAPNEIETEGDYFIRHRLDNKVSLLTKLHEAYFRPAVEVKDLKVVDFYFLERIDLKGFKISNKMRKNTKEYIPNENNEFVFRASDGKEFRIPVPLMWFQGELSYPYDLVPRSLNSNEISHRLFKKDGNLFYSKEPTLKGKIWLSSIGLGLLYIDSAASYFSESNDGHIELANSSASTAQVAWDNAQAGTHGTFTVQSNYQQTNRVVKIYRGA